MADPAHDGGVGQMVLLLWHRDARWGRFDAALSFVAHRAEIESTPDHGPLPKATPGVTQNATELDAFLAGGGCG